VGNLKSGTKSINYSCGKLAAATVTRETSERERESIERLIGWSGCEGEMVIRRRRGAVSLRNWVSFWVPSIALKLD
jgi:hypothetical protein